MDELGSKFFFLSNLAYKLGNLLVFEEKNHVKLARIEFFLKIICLELNFTHQFEVCYKVGKKGNATGHRYIKCNLTILFNSFNPAYG